VEHHGELQAAMADDKTLNMLKKCLESIEEHEMETDMVETVITLPSGAMPVGLFRVTQTIAVIVFGQHELDVVEGGYSHDPDSLRRWATSRADAMSILADGSTRFCPLGPGDMKRLGTFMDA
jgi:hypothetical protein